MKKMLKMLLVASMVFTFLVTGVTAQSQNQVIDSSVNVYKMIIEPDYDKI